MDFGQFFRVIWRFKYLVVPGIVVAVALAVFSVARVSLSKPHLVYRQSEQYVSYSTLLVTQHGFPWGQVATGTASSADPSRFVGLSVVWSQLALGDSVRQIMLKSGPINGQIEAAPVLDANTQEALPLISIAAIANTPQTAVSLARRETNALLTFLSIQQSTSDIAPQNRISLVVTAKAKEAKVFKGRSKTLPAVVFLAVLIAVIGLAFLLENLRPRAMPLRQAKPRADQADDVAA